MFNYRQNRDKKFGRESFDIWKNFSFSRKAVFIFFAILLQYSSYMLAYVRISALLHIFADKWSRDRGNLASSFERAL